MEQVEKYRPFIKEVFQRYFPVKEASLSELLKIARIKKLKKGELLLDVGAISKDIHILYKGIVVSYFLDNEGNAYHKNIFLSGNYVGSMVSALKNKASDFALEAIEDSTLINFNFIKFKELINSYQDLSRFYIAYLEKNWVVDKEKREIEIVMKDAATRYLDFIQAHPKIEERVSLHFIASHLGITPTQLSRIRKKIKALHLTQRIAK